MTTTIDHGGVTISSLPRISDSASAMENLREGLKDTIFEIDDPLVPLYDGHPALKAYEEMLTATIAEIAPEVARMLDELLASRLPWAWESKG